MILSNIKFFPALKFLHYRKLPPECYKQRVFHLSKWVIRWLVEIVSRWSSNLRAMTYDLSLKVHPKRELCVIISIRQGIHFGIVRSCKIKIKDFIMLKLPLQVIPHNSIYIRRWVCLVHSVLRVTKAYFYSHDCTCRVK